MEEVKEKENTVKDEQPKKLSYEELENVAYQLKEQNNNLYMKLQALDNGFTRLELLFKVLKYKESFPVEFVDKCAKEVVNLITLPEKKDKKEEK